MSDTGSSSGYPGESDTDFLSSGLYFDEAEPIPSISGSVPNPAGVLSEVAELPIGVKFPLELGTNRSGLFQMEFDANKALVTSFKNYLNTSKGDRVGNPGYGADLRSLVTEYQELGDEFESLAMSRIQAGLGQALLDVIQLETFSTQLVEDDDPGMLRLDLSIKFSARNSAVNLSNQVVNVSFYII